MTFDIEQATFRWNETEIVLDRISKKSSAESTSEDILRLGGLYTELLSDLNKLNSDNEHTAERQRVNKLALRAYGAIYQPKSMGIMDMVKFFVFSFPKVVKAKINFIIPAMLIFVFSSFIGFLCISEKSKLIDLVIAPAEQQRLKSSMKSIDTSKPHPSSRESGFGLSSYIMTNNIRVSAKAFATGIFLGVGTIFVLVLNGLMLGGLASLYTSAGLASLFWSLILPHGGIELLCIFISGGAGLVIGNALINPGNLKRKDCLVKEGGESIKLILGIIPMLVIAGLIEAYITPAYLPESVKFALSAVFLILTLVWLFLGAVYEPEDLVKLFSSKEK